MFPEEENFSEEGNYRSYEVNFIIMKATANINPHGNVSKSENPRIILQI